MPAGSLAVGERVVQDLTIHNEGGDPADLAMDFLDPRAVFSVVNAARTLKAGSSLKLLVDFAPQVGWPGLHDASVREGALSLLMSGVLLQLCTGCRPAGSADFGPGYMPACRFSKGLFNC